MISAKEAAKKAAAYFERRQKMILRERVEKLKRVEQSMVDFVKLFSTVEKVAVVGSLIKPQFYRSDSDIDLVVKGLEIGDLLKAGSYLEKKLGTSVDLILWEDMPRSGMQKRKVIYEKN